MVYIHTHTHTHTMEYNSAMKKKILLFLTTWVELSLHNVNNFSSFLKGTPFYILHMFTLSFFFPFDEDFSFRKHNRSDRTSKVPHYLNGNAFPESTMCLACGCGLEKCLSSVALITSSILVSILSWSSKKQSTKTLLYTSVLETRFSLEKRSVHINSCLSLQRH